VSYDQYLREAADRLELAARSLRPVLIHAASNYEGALPALIAARRLGIPFCYEVRGLWEYTAASKRPGWEQTERFELDRRLEAHTAAHADRIFTLTKALAAELVSRGVPENRIELLPNAVNLSFFQKAERDLELAGELGVGADTFVCGYIGSVVKYEGLDDLIAAMPALVQFAPDCKLLVVGGGDELTNLREQAALLGVSNYVVFTGKVPHADVLRYFSLLSAIALPRKPYTVCKLVSPLKPFEAMAMQVPQVVSDVDALGEIFEEGETALFHKAGDPDSLAQAMIQLAASPALRKLLADNAFEWVKKNGQWDDVVAPVTKFYSSSFLK
jgi:glycosyltransferase involved in cell wall biosynthesis